MRSDFGDFEKKMRKQFALDHKGIQWRKSFYAVSARREIFREDYQLALVCWNDRVARQTPDAAVEIRVELGSGEIETNLVPALTLVALRAGTIAIGMVKVHRQRIPDMELQIDRSIPLRARSGTDLLARDLDLFGEIDERQRTV